MFLLGKLSHPLASAVAMVVNFGKKHNELLIQLATEGTIGKIISSIRSKMHLFYIFS